VGRVTKGSRWRVYWIRIPMTAGSICDRRRTHYWDGIGKGSDLYYFRSMEPRPEHSRTAELLVGQGMSKQEFRRTGPIYRGYDDDGDGGSEFIGHYVVPKDEIMWFGYVHFDRSLVTSDRIYERILQSKNGYLSDNDRMEHNKISRGPKYRDVVCRLPYEE